MMPYTVVLEDLSGARASAAPVLPVVGGGVAVPVVVQYQNSGGGGSQSGGSQLTVRSALQTMTGQMNLLIQVSRIHNGKFHVDRENRLLDGVCRVEA